MITICQLGRRIAAAWASSGFRAGPGNRFVKSQMCFRPWGPHSLLCSYLTLPLQCKGSCRQYRKEQDGRVPIKLY